MTTRMQHLFTNALNAQSLQGQVGAQRVLLADPLAPGELTAEQQMVEHALREACAKSLHRCGRVILHKGHSYKIFL